MKALALPSHQCQISLLSSLPNPTLYISLNCMLPPMIQQISILPARPLRPYIEEYHWIGNPTVLEDWIEEDNLPMPVSGLCFQFGGGQPIMISHGEVEKEKLPPGYVLPPSTKRFTVHFRGGVQMLAVIFRPAAFFEFFGWPLYEFSDQTVPLSDTEGRVEFRSLQEHLQEKKAPAQQALVLDTYFLQKIKNKKESNPAILHALAEINKKRGIARPRHLLAKSGVGSRQLRRLFNDHLGMPPRDFLRIYRFFSAYWAILSGRFENLTQLALDNGYYDQAHFIHEFQEFTGMSPHQFIKKQFLILDKVAWKNEDN